MMEVAFLSYLILPPGAENWDVRIWDVTSPVEFLEPLVSNFVLAILTNTSKTLSPTRRTIPRTEVS